MFPLGTVLFPAQPLPLSIFEPRYRQMTHDLLNGDGRFGVVLIERGFEVGGGDVRTDLGTVAQLVQCQPYPDGRFRLLAVGVERLRVIEWLPDEPYPRARVEVVVEAPVDPADAIALGAAQHAASASVRRALALASELGWSAAPAGIELADDPVAASFQLCAIAPLGPIDRQRLLAAPDAHARLVLVDELVRDAMVLFEAQLSSGADPPPAAPTD